MMMPFAAVRESLVAYHVRRPMLALRSASDNSGHSRPALREGAGAKDPERS
jgi:hypothetical protein